MPTTIRIADTDELLLACFPVMQELRPHLEQTAFMDQAKRQANQGYRIAFVEADGRITAVAGFRIVEMLAWGRALYVDDLVSASWARGQGHGSRLFDWLVQHARESSCSQFHLDSGVQRHVAHRFYLHKGMDITSHHFAITP